jgi:hypothetical protein
MRLNPVFCTALIGACLFAREAIHLSARFQTVYVVQMAHGLDQYITGRLTSSRVLWVVLEPRSADAVLTDTVDDSFWTWLNQAYPSTAGATDAESARSLAFRRDLLSGVKSRGTIFLVDPRKRLVLWSAYALPRSSSPSELDRTANQITGQLKIAFGKQ